METDITGIPEELEPALNSTKRQLIALGTSNSIEAALLLTDIQNISIDGIKKHEEAVLTAKVAQLAVLFKTIPQRDQFDLKLI